jgi:hypothetical protein
MKEGRAVYRTRSRRPARSVLREPDVGRWVGGDPALPAVGVEGLVLGDRPDAGAALDDWLAARWRRRDSLLNAVLGAVEGVAGSPWDPAATRAASG